LERQERIRAAEAEREQARARCPACPAIRAEEALLLAELRLTLKPWQTGVDDLRVVAAALEAAACAPVRKRPSGRRTRPSPPAAS
jgi:hypothetical protein